MKLKTKLLPLVGIAATAAVVTPLVTSCKSAYDMIDITKGYTPKTQSSVAGEKNQQEATQTYIDDVKKNPEIFKADFIYGVYQKVLNTKTEFLNSPEIWEQGRGSGSGYVGAANFKLNSLKAGVSTPTFGSTKIAYPGEPAVTYPTVSFEYKIQIDYKYEYLGQMDETGLPMSSWEGDGYHSRTISLETSVKYTNVPFLAIAHTDGLNTYWQVTPLDVMVTNATEGNTPTVHYYNQDYMFKYMSDDWAIDINATANITEKFASSSGETTTKEMSPNFTYNISTYEKLRNFTRSSSIDDDSYDLANYYDMLVSFANFGFKSYYLQSVAQKPEIQATGEAQGFGKIDDKLASFGAFYLPQTFDGKVKIFAGYAADGKTPTGKIELTSIGSSTPVTLTIGTDAEGAELTQSGTFKAQWGVDNQPLSWAEGATVAPGNYNFLLPSTIVAQFIPTTGTGESFTQLVYLNQNTLPIQLVA